MTHLVKIQFALTLSIIKLTLQTGAVQQKEVILVSFVDDELWRTSAAGAKGKGGAIALPHIAKHANSPNHIQCLMDFENIRSPQTQPLATITPRHQLELNAKNFLSCSADKFACADGLECISELYVCDGWKKCDDGSDESDSLCTPPCSTDMFACDDGLKCVPKQELCSGLDFDRGCCDFSHNFPSQCNNCSADHLFRCNYNGVDVCMNNYYKCDGKEICDDGSDESEFFCTPPCSTDMFACADGLKCTSNSGVCFGSPQDGCHDYSNNFPSQCDNCSADHLFKCQWSSVDICLNVQYKCDGINHCVDFSDELVSECPGCVDDSSKFTCRVGGQLMCWSEGFRCDGSSQRCDDGSDQDPAACGNCTSRPDRTICRDGNSCFKTEYSCDGFIHCSDGSDESDTYSQCNYCTEEGSVPCPGFPGNCGKLCDGKPTCPDKWDELLSTCRSIQFNQDDAEICSQNDSLYQCKDGSLCLSGERLCNGYKDCADGSDEVPARLHAMIGAVTISAIIMKMFNAMEVALRFRQLVMPRTNHCVRTTVIWTSPSAKASVILRSLT